MDFFMIIKVFFSSQYLYSATQPFFEGLNLYWLLRGEQLKEKAIPAMKGYYLNYFVYRHFFQCIKITTPKLFIYPFENQPWEKIMLLALKTTGFSIKTVAYQHSSIPDLLLTYDLGKDEIETSPLPSTILASSFHNMRRLADAGFPSVYMGGSLRYQKRDYVVHQGSPAILLLSPIDIDHTLALISYGIKKLSKQSILVLIKLHPDISKKKVLRYFKKFPSMMNFLEGDLVDAVHYFDTVVHTGTTAAAECLGMGKKVYKLKSELLDIDPVSGMIQQNEIDENTDLHNCGYIPYDANIDFLYETVSPSIWLNVVNGQVS
jgi:hypothetical protein